MRRFFSLLSVVAALLFFNAPVADAGSGISETVGGGIQQVLLRQCTDPRTKVMAAFVEGMVTAITPQTIQLLAKAAAPKVLLISDVRQEPRLTPFRPR